MTDIEFLLHLNCSMIPFFELSDGVMIVVILGATFICILRNPYHKCLEILYLILLEAANSNL